MEPLSDRARAVLGTVIREYIKTSEPVGSRVIAMSSCLGLSPASIRKIMAELESAGYLRQMHTSGGRVPTEKSFKYYVDGLLETESLMKGDMEMLRSIFSSAGTLRDGAKDAARLLSALTRYAVMVSATISENLVIREMRVIKIDERSLMVIIVSSAGSVRTRLVRVDEAGVKRMDFDRASNYLTSIGAGLSIGRLKERILGEMLNEKVLADEILKNALKLSSAALERDETGPEAVCILEGATHMLDQPEFRADVDRMKRLFNVFEEKSMLIRMLDDCISESGPTVRLGSEISEKGLEGLSLVAAPYSAGDGLTGSVAVIGPVWMDYPKIIPLVGYTAELFASEFPADKKIN